MKVPYWFMNFDDFDYLFDPTAGTQAPILKRAIGLARNAQQSSESDSFPIYYLNRLNEICSLCINPDHHKLNQIVYYDIQGIISFLNDLDIGFDFSSLVTNLENLKSNNNTPLTKSGTFINGRLDQSLLFSVGNSLSIELSKLQNFINTKKVLQDKNIDLPIWFNFDELITTFFDEAINEQESSSNRIREYVSTLRLRLQSYSNDERIAVPLLLNRKENIQDSLAKFLAFVLGDFCKIYQDTDVDGF